MNKSNRLQKINLYLERIRTTIEIRNRLIKSNEGSDLYLVEINN